MSISVRMLGDEQTRAASGVTTWEVRAGDRVARIEHKHRWGDGKPPDPWYRVTGPDSPTYAVRSRDFAAAVRCARRQLGVQS